jgi:hypothetical protein
MPNDNVRLPVAGHLTEELTIIPSLRWHLKARVGSPRLDALDHGATYRRQTLLGSNRGRQSAPGVRHRHGDWNMYVKSRSDSMQRNCFILTDFCGLC